VSGLGAMTSSPPGHTHPQEVPRLCGGGFDADRGPYRPVPVAAPGGQRGEPRNVAPQQPRGAGGPAL